MYYDGLSKTTRCFLQFAARLASTSECNYKHAAIIVKGGRVLGTGVNRTRNFCLNVDDPERCSSIHAEIAALKRCKDVKDATIYIARVNRQGETRMSKPCNLCQEALDLAGVKKIVYTT